MIRPARAVLDVRLGRVTGRSSRLLRGDSAGEGRFPVCALRVIRNSVRPDLSVSRSPAPASATTTVSAASFCSPTCTSTTCLSGTIINSECSWDKLYDGMDGLRAGICSRCISLVLTLRSHEFLARGARSRLEIRPAQRRLEMEEGFSRHHGRIRPEKMDRSRPPRRVSAREFPRELCSGR